MSKARAEIEISANDSKLSSGLARARARMDSWARAASSSAGRAFNSTMAGMSKIKIGGGTGSRMLGAFGGSMMTRGFDALLDGAKNAHAFQSELDALGRATRVSIPEQESLGKRFHEISDLTGVGSDEIVKAARSYFDLTSDVKGMNAAMEKFAKISRASGSSMTDINKVAAAMSDSLGIGPEQFEEAFGALINGANEGKVSLEEMGSEFTSMLPKFAQFGTLGMEGLRQAQAMFQVIAKDTGSAAEANTETIAMMAMLQSRAAQLKKFAGIDVFEGTGKNAHLRPALDLVEEIRTKVTDVRKHGDIFGENVRGRGALNMLLAKHETTKRVLAASRELGAVERDYQRNMASSSGRTEVALNRMKESIVAAFTPERIEGFVSALERVGAVVGKVMTGFKEIAKLADELRGKTLDEQKAEMDKEAKNFNPQGRRNAAKEALARAEAKAPMDVAAAEADHPLASLIRATGSPMLPTGDYLARFGGGADRAFAAEQTAMANVEERRIAKFKLTNPQNFQTDPWDSPTPAGPARSPEQSRAELDAILNSMKALVGLGDKIEAAVERGASKARTSVHMDSNKVDKALGESTLARSTKT